MLRNDAFVRRRRKCVVERLRNDAFKRRRKGV
jgi:hypothetical protein